MFFSERSVHKGGGGEGRGCRRVGQAQGLGRFSYSEASYQPKSKVAQ